MPDRAAAGHAGPSLAAGESSPSTSTLLVEAEAAAPPLVWYRIYFQRPRGSRSWGDEGRTAVTVEGEAERDRILSRKRPRVAHWELARLHDCSQCDRRGPWTEEWSWFGSWKDLDEGKDVLKFCSDACASAHKTGEPRGGRYEPSKPGENKDRWDALRLAREAPTAHRKVPMPEWPGPGSCRWCLKPTVWESGKRAGKPAPGRNWHNACYYEYRLHTEIAAQFDFLFDRDGPRCQICGDGGYASAGQHFVRPEGMSIAQYLRTPREQLESYTALKPSIALEVDHVIPLWRAWFFGGDLEARRRWYGPPNLWLICVDCHKAKTAIEAAERAEFRRTP